MHGMPGRIGGIDLTAPVPMGDYSDFRMHPPGDPQPVAGICHAKGENAGLPPVWMISCALYEPAKS